MSLRIPLLAAFFLLLAGVDAAAVRAQAPALPRVLIIGDSISIGYTPPLQKLLAGKAIVERIGGDAKEPVNGGDSGNVLKNLPAWIGDKKYDVIHFNCGLHDLKFTEAKKTYQQSPEVYAKNLEAIAAWGKEHTQARWIFATTTPVNDERSRARKAGFERFNKDVVEYNGIARRVLGPAKLPIDDLYETVEKAGRDTSLGKDGVHFTPAAYEMLARQVAASIEGALKK
jgi:lysophospholipase L1-like esterase